MIDLKDFKDVAGYEKQYAVDRNGNVYSYKRNMLLTPFVCNTGYLGVNLTSPGGVRKQYHIHRLVADQFIENTDPKNLTCVNHKDENKLNNSIDNLEFITRGDNVRYSARLRKLRKNF